MNNIKIACPACGQHIACDETWAGRQIACPTCQNPLVIPAVAVAPAASAPPPNQSPARSASVPSRPHSATTSSPSVPTPVPRPAPVPVPRPGPVAPSGKTSRLAIASLACSLLLGPVGAVAGIIMGHVAKSKIRRDPSLRGSGLATTGLVIGYLFGVLWAIWFAMFGLAWMTSEGRAKTSQPSLPPITRIPPNSGSKGGGNPKPYITAPKIEPQLEMPPEPVAGKIGPHQFTCDSATLDKGGLTLRQGVDATASAEITVTSFGNDHRALGGKTISVLPKTRGSIPQVSVLWHENGRTENLVQKRDYTMVLRLDAFADDTVSGHIDLQLPGKPGVAVKGNFIARVR